MLATLSSPGTLPPVQIGERSLITGSLVNNLPVNIAQKWGADVIIVVDIGTYIRTGDDLNSIFSIVDQVSHLLQEKSSQASILMLSDRDILIQPDIQAHKETDVSDPKINIEKGVQAVAKIASRFELLRLDEQQYAALHADRVARRSLNPIISRIDLNNDSRVDDEVILAKLSQGWVVDTAALSSRSRARSRWSA